MDRAMKGQQISDPSARSHRMAGKNPGPYLHLGEKSSQTSDNQGTMALTKQASFRMANDHINGGGWESDSSRP